eukprot:CFRG6793T1
MTDMFEDMFGFYRPIEEKEKVESVQKGVATADKSRVEKWQKAKVWMNGTPHISDDKIKDLCRLGVPSNQRGDVWLRMSGAGEIMKQNEDKYVQLLDRMEMINFSMTKPIETDLRRTFPTHKLFFTKLEDEKPMVKSLRNVLTAQAVNVASVGYCQGLNFLAALLLLVTNNEEKSFHILSVVVDEKLAGYYTSSMDGLILDLKVLTAIIAERLPVLSAHFEANDVDLGPLITPWLISVFVLNAPFHTVLRIWDSFLAEGVKVLFRVCIAIFQMNEAGLLKMKDRDVLFRKIKDLPTQLNDADNLMKVAFGLSKFSMKSIQQKRIAIYQASRVCLSSS